MTETRNDMPTEHETAAEAARFEAEAEASAAGAETAAIIDRLQQERDDAIAARQRALADFANYQRRSRENEQRERFNGVVAVLRTLLPVLDHFEIAVSQDASRLTVEQLLGGVKMVQAELIKALETHGVQKIEARRGEEFDPYRHEAVLRQPAADVKPNHVVSCLQSGVMVGDMVLRPAKVAVAPEGE